MESNIDYKNLKDKLVINDNSKYHFEKIKKLAIKKELELKEDEFIVLFKLSVSEKDVNWIMNQMNTYEVSFTEALISYIIAD